MSADGELQPQQYADVVDLSMTARTRPWLVRGLLGSGLLGIAAAVGLLCYHFLQSTGDQPPAEAAAGAAVNVGRWQHDPGAVYDRAPVTPTPSPVPTPAVTPVPPAPDTTPYQMTIERIGVDAPVVAKGLDANRVPIVPLNSWQVAWYTFSAQPGTGGNAVFAGHVTWSGRAVFYSLDKLVQGDVIHIRAQTGDSFTYIVTESYTVSETDPNAPAQVMGPTSSDVITIITCDGEFYYTGDPVFNGSYTQRRVVRAALTSQILVSELGSS